MRVIFDTNKMIVKKKVADEYDVHLYTMLHDGFYFQNDFFSKVFVLHM